MPNPAAGANTCFGGALLLQRQVRAFAGLFERERFGDLAADGPGAGGFAPARQPTLAWSFSWRIPGQHYYAGGIGCDSEHSCGQHAGSSFSRLAGPEVRQWVESL